MRRIDVLSIWYQQAYFDAQGNGGISLNDFFLSSNPLMEISVNFLIELTHGGFFCKYFSFALPCSTMFDWIDLWRFYSSKSWRFPLDGFVCKNIISFVKWDQEKNPRVGNIHMIRDNKGLVCPYTYLIHRSFLVFMVDNHYFLGILLFIDH